jgi:hypothetical protein
MYQETSFVEQGHSASAPPGQIARADLDNVCDRLRELHRQRQDLHRAEKSLTLQIKAKCRRLCGGDKKEAEVLYRAMSGKGEHDLAAMALAVSAPFLEARSIIKPQREAQEKAMEREAKKLPVWEWVEQVKGFGIGGLAAIVGEAGNLGDYDTHSKLWKRMGLAVIGGERQRRVKGDAAIEQGYCASRRSVVWNVGSSLFKAQSARMDKETGEIKTPAGFYRLIYDKRKEYELGRVETKGHAHNRSTRYMEKKLIRDLWNAWRA